MTLVLSEGSWAHRAGRQKWLNSPVRRFSGTVFEILDHIPSFERRCFSLTQPGDTKIWLNNRLDMIVRKPIGGDQAFVPVGVVSMGYVLVQHTTVVEKAMEALRNKGISLDDVKAELLLTEYGERMALSLYLPKSYNFEPGDGYPMALRFECFNSVDGSTRFRALVGWFRFVCANGLVVGVTRSDVRRRHIGHLRVEHLDRVFAYGLEEATREKKLFEQWRRQTISRDRLINWVESSVRRLWGFKLATRVFHIALTGFDVEIAESYTGRSPTTIAVQRTRPVPGAPDQATNLFDVAQILAWVASSQRDLEEQIKKRDHIPALIAMLATQPASQTTLF